MEIIFNEKVVLTTSESTAQLFAAIAECRAENPKAFILSKDSDVNAGKYKFKYVKLGTIISNVSAPLATKGVIITQSLFALGIITSLQHSSGEFYTSVFEYPLFDINVYNTETKRNELRESKPEDWQKYGSAVTYARRYAIISILSMSTDDLMDDDAASLVATSTATVSFTPSAITGTASTAPKFESVAKSLTPIDFKDVSYASGRKLIVLKEKISAGKTREELDKEYSFTDMDAWDKMWPKKTLDSLIEGQMDILVDSALDTGLYEAKKAK